MPRLWLFALGCLGWLGVGAAAAEPTLDPVFAAHGGLAAWNAFGSAEYDLEGWPFSERAPLSDHQLVDLKSRRAVIASDRYRLGFDGREVWILPDEQALGTSPRFYLFTAFYIFGMPFVFNDPGVQARPAEIQEVDGRSYQTWRIGFSTGTGEIPDNDFVVFIDTATQRMRMAHYVALYPAVRERRALDPALRHALVVEEWQDVRDVLVPRQVTFYRWQDGRLGQRLGACRYAHVRFDRHRPVPEIFARPGGARVDPFRLPAKP